MLGQRFLVKKQNGIQTYINTYRDDVNVNIHYRLDISHKPDKLIAAIAHPYSKYYYSKQRIAIPPSNGLLTIKELQMNYLP